MDRVFVNGQFIPLKQHKINISKEAQVMRNLELEKDTVSIELSGKEHMNTLRHYCVKYNIGYSQKFKKLDYFRVLLESKKFKLSDKSVLNDNDISNLL